MRLEEFRELADTWGGDVDRWPEQVRPAAREFAATPAGVDLIAQAKAFDAVFGPRRPVAPERARRVAHAVTLRIAAETQRREERSGWWRADWFIPAASAACSGLLGVAIALALPPTAANEEPEPPSALAAILDSGTVVTGLEIQ